MTTIEELIDPIYDIYYPRRYRVETWWARHISKDMEKAEKLERIANLAQRFARLPRDVQEEVAKKSLELLKQQDEGKEDD